MAIKKEGILKEPCKMDRGAGICSGLKNKLCQGGGYCPFYKTAEEAAAGRQIAGKYYAERGLRIAPEYQEINRKIEAAGE